MSEKRIVIADDEPDILRIWSTAFRVKGFEVLEASDGETALALIKENQPDAAILDFMMPRMDGIAVCEQARQFDPSLVVLIVSGVASDRLIRLSGAAGANQYVEKPVSPLALIEAVKRHLEQRASSAS